MAAHQARVGRAVAIAAILTVALSSPSAQSPVTRIVSLVPSVTEMLFAIGAGPRVVGVSSFDTEPPEVDDLERVGALFDPDLERVLLLRPDLVVIYGTQTDLRQQVERAGIPLFSYLNTDLAGVSGTMRDLGRRLGIVESAERAASRLDHQLEAVRDRTRGRPRPLALVVFDHEPGSLRSLSGAGRAGFHHDMLELAGADNALGDVERPTVELTTEAVIRLVPDVILDLHYGDRAVGDLERERRNWDRLSTLPAVRNGRVHVLAGDRFVVPGPRIGGATEEFARLLHPDAF